MGNVQPFGPWLRQRRKALDWTQEELATRVGCSPAAIQMIEQGQRRPSRQIAELLAASLRIPDAERAGFIALARASLPVARTGSPPAEVHTGPAPPAANNLPTPPITLLGRVADLGTIQSLLLHDDVRLLTLTGPPGVGKTSLAVEAGLALREQPEFQDGLCWVALASVSAPALVLPSIARLLGVPDVGTQPLLETLKGALKHRRLLLLLDNFEHVIGAATDLAELLAACPHLKLLMTSRERLNLRAEREFNVLPLPLPDMADTTGRAAAALAANPAVALFVERAQAVDRDFSLTPENASLVAAICARLDGLPLAIELVAARSRMLPLPALLARLRDLQGPAPLNLLAGGARDLPARHKTLRDAIGWSYHLLDAGEQILFSRLGVFRGGFTLGAAEAICNARSDLGLEVFDGAAQLLHKSLLKREILPQEEAAGEGSFAMLETIRQYALERLRARGAEEALRLLHAEYFLGLAASLDLWAIGESEQVLYHRLDRNHDNLRAALTWTIDNGRLDLAAQLGVALSRYWELRGYYTEGRAWLLRIMAAQGAAAELDPAARATRAMLLMYAGRLSCYLSDYGPARSFLDECVSLSREWGLEGWRRLVPNQLGLVAWKQGDHAAAQSLLEDSLRARQESGSKASIAGALWMLGSLAGECGDFARAETLLHDALALGREAGDMFTTTFAIRDLGTTLCYEGKYAEAVPLLEEALALARRAQFAVGIDWALAALGLAVLGLGDYDRAEEHFRASLVLARKIDQHRIPDSLEGLAEVELTRAAGAAGEHVPRHSARAAVLLGAAAGARRILDMAIIPVRAPVRERLIAQAQAHLGPAAYERGYARGQGLSLDDAIAWGLGSERDAGP